MAIFKDEKVTLYDEAGRVIATGAASEVEISACKESKQDNTK